MTDERTPAGRAIELEVTIDADPKAVWEAMACSC